jgi:ribulose kinase
MSETVSTEYKIEVSEDFKNCLEQNSFVVQLLQQESDQHNAVIGICIDSKCSWSCRGADATPCHSGTNQPSSDNCRSTWSLYGSR